MRISHHAAERYAQRVLNFKINTDEEFTDDAYKALKSMVYQILKPYYLVIKAQNRGAIILEDAIYVFEDNCIVTCKYRKWKRT